MPSVFAEIQTLPPNNDSDTQIPIIHYYKSKRILSQLVDLLEPILEYRNLHFSIHLSVAIGWRNNQFWLAADNFLQKPTAAMF